MFGLVPFASRNNLAKKEDAFGRLFDIFNEPFLNSAMAPLSGLAAGLGSFKVDVKDLGAAYELTADLPGIKKEEIFLSYDNSYLTIQTKVDESKEEKDETSNYIRRERRQGSVSRSFYIDNIDEANVKAEFKDGVLKVELPKAEQKPEAKQIEIEG